MKTKCMVFAEVPDLHDFEDIVQFFNQYGCKMKDEKFVWFYGKVLNDYIFKKAPTERHKSIISDVEVYVCFNIHNVKGYENIYKEMLDAGMRWIDDVIVNCQEAADILWTLLSKKELKEIQNSENEFDD